MVIRDKTPTDVFKDKVNLKIILPNKDKVELDGKTIIGRLWERIKNG